MESKSAFHELAKAAVMQPQESSLTIMKSKTSIKVGIPREVAFQENRVAITPQAVNLLVSNGIEVLVEAGAGKEAKFYDREYEECGAKITFNTADIFACDIVIKVSFPTAQEIEWMSEGITLISALHFPMLQKELIDVLCKKKIIAICFEYLKDESLNYPIIQCMSEIAGSTSILIAAEYLSNVNRGKGVMLGGISGIPPSEVIILGAGTVGQFACQAALGLGAEVKVFDNSIYRLRRLQNALGSRIYTSIIHPNILKKALKSADVCIGAIRSTQGRTPMIVTEEMVQEMKYGSVIIDVSIDQGGCFETSKVTDHNNPVFEYAGVIHYCVPNIPSRVARTASYGLSNVFAPLMVQIVESGGIRNYIWEKEGIRSGIYIYKGNITNQAIASKFGYTYKDLELLIASNI